MSGTVLGSEDLTMIKKNRIDPDWFRGRTEEGSQGKLPYRLSACVSQVMPIPYPECPQARELVWMNTHPQANVSIRTGGVSREVKRPQGKGGCEDARSGWGITGQEFRESST